MVSTLKRSEFVKLFEGTEVDVAGFSEETWQGLEGAGVNRRELLRVAGADGVVREPEEIRRLFELVDSFDHNGDAQSIDVSRSAADAGRPALTPAGTIFTALASSRRAAFKVEINEFVARYAQGEIDLKALSAEQIDRLRELGIDVQRLQRTGSSGGLVDTEQRLQRLFMIIDTLDTNGDAHSVDITKAAPLGSDPSQAELTAAGEAIAILSSVYRPYEQGFVEYEDLTRAALAGEPPPEPVDLAVKHFVQPDATSCYYTAVRMLRNFDKKAEAELEDKDVAHYMARIEDKAGAVAGRRSDFVAGRTYIDSCLDAGRPVVVGLSHSARGYNLDKVTDHFIIITGRGVDEEGRVFYSYNDSATAGEHKRGRLYVDADSSMLFRPGFADSTNPFFRLDYQVTQLRTYADQPFEQVTGQAAAPSPE